MVIDILKKRISDLGIERQRKNVIIDYLHSQLNLKATDNSLSSIATRNLNGTSNQDSVGDKLAEASNSNAATISTIRSSKQQSSNSQIKRKIFVAGDSMLENIHERRLSKQHTVKVKKFPGATTETILEKLEKLLESKSNMLIVHAGIYPLYKPLK